LARSLASASRASSRNRSRSAINQSSNRAPRNSKPFQEIATVEVDRVRERLRAASLNQPLEDDGIDVPPRPASRPTVSLLTDRQLGSAGARMRRSTEEGLSQAAAGVMR
jgi:hypothetical protein